jgi:hypothetical protein
LRCGKRGDAVNTVQIAAVIGETISATVDVEGARVVLTVDGKRIDMSESEAWSLHQHLRSACRRVAQLETELVKMALAHMGIDT